MLAYHAWLRLGPHMIAIVLSSVLAVTGQTSGVHLLDSSSFQRIVIDEDIPGAYQIKSVDLNQDGREDLVVVSTAISEIYWYENPHWTRHVLLDQTTGNIDLAAHDIDDDGDYDLALACEFSLRQSTSGGVVMWLENPGQDGDWLTHSIDTIPTSHRLRWANLKGNSMPELVNLPIIGHGAQAPQYQGAVPFCYYEIPREPASSSWQKHMIDSSLEMAHGMYKLTKPGYAYDQLLTASFGGVHWFDRQGDEGPWRRLKVGSGHEGPRPRRGASEVALGQLDTTLFFATIEPWHGHEVVWYQRSFATPESLWKRQVIDTTFSDGHALAVADLNRDGYDEIIAGHRGSPFNLFIYQFDPENWAWHRIPLDLAGMSAAGLEIVDYNADGWPDIAAAGSRTHNVVIYKNLGTGKADR